MPCSPSDISINIPSGPTGPSIPGFGVPSALNIPSLNPLPAGFPEDLLDLLNKLQLLVPPGALKPQLSPNFGKDVFDSILKLLDQFMPFLMLYKFFLPILNIIVCIIEVLCAIANPFKLIRAIRRLFNTCIPEFLNLFPIFALIIMIISLLLLLLALIEYIVGQVIKLILALLRNIAALNNAFQEANSTSVLAIAKKIGSLLCIFQNFFVLLSVFSIIIQVIKDIISLTFNIPPCDDSNGSDAECCTPDVCPTIVKQNYTRSTGSFKYLNNVSIETSLVLSPSLGNFNYAIRPESWQLYDTKQNIAEAFRNIIDGYDVPTNPDDPPPFFKPIFFPTDANITNQTSIKQVPYTLDLRMYYNPLSWGRSGSPKFIQFKNCIMLKPPVLDLTIYDNSTTPIETGVIILGGGLGYEDNGTTVLTGFGSDGITPISSQATLENFIHMPNASSVTPIFLPSDGYQFQDITYTFKPNLAFLQSKDIITLGCMPDFALTKNFINTVYAGDVSLKTKLLGDLLNSKDFPDTNAAQDCLSTALSALRSNLTVQGVAQFQATTTICLDTLKGNTNNALSSLIGLGFDPCKSTFELSPKIQFTTKPIKVTVDLKERNGLPITTGINSDTATDISNKLKAHNTFGKVSRFAYDGYHSFVADLTSDIPGNGNIMISFDNNTLCTNVNDPPSHTLQNIDYQFVYAPATSDGKPRRDAGDLARESSGGKDSV